MNAVSFIIKIGLVSLLAIACYSTSLAYTTDRIFNYETGKFVEGDIYDDEFYPEVEITENSTNAVIKIDIKYAFVYDARLDYCENSVKWVIPKFREFLTPGKPQVPHDYYTIYLPKGYKNATITILEEEYKDFNFELIPSQIEPIESVSELYMVPYQGFFPTELADAITYGYDETYYTFVAVWPVAYDYENKIVRAYSHLKIRLDYLEEVSGIEEVGADDAPAEYFNLQGIRVEKPEHGVYIERKGGKATKVVY